MKLAELFSLLLLIGFGYCQPMTNDEICGLFMGDGHRVLCKFQSIELMLRWKNSHVTFIKDRQNLVTIKCAHKMGIDFKNFPMLDMSDVKELKIESCSIEDEHILSSVMHFFNFSGVSVLHLKVAKNYTISSTLLHTFSKIKKLILMAEDMNAFDENAFETFTALENLTITAYDITLMPRQLFHPLKNLKHLDISFIAENSKKDKKEFIMPFNHIRNLEKFSLRGVRWPSEMEFSFNAVLANIRITNCNLLAVDQKKILGSAQASHLNLSHNSIQQLPDQFLWSLENFLIDLDLSHNKLQAITDGIFEKSAELETLDLSHNKIERLEKNAFSNLEFLKILKLNNNILTIIDLPILFNGLKKLQSMSLNGNQIYEMTGELPKGLKISDIDLSNNILPMFYITKFWPRSSQKLTVKLDGNDLNGVSFPHSTPTAGSKKALKIDLGEDGTMICNCHTVRLHNYFHGINLSSDVVNYFEIFPKSVKCINSSYDKVIALDPMKVDCPLDISRHENMCPENCICSVGVPDNKLTVKCSNITDVPAMPPKVPLNIKQITKIKLDIEGNNVKYLPSKRLENYNSVTEIYARKNKIILLTLDNIPDNLDILDLRENLLQMISPSVTYELAVIVHTLHLSLNPWDCSDPNAQQLIEFMELHQDKIEDWNLNRCVNGDFFLSVKGDDECYSQIYMTIVLCLFAFLCLGVTILCWRNKTPIVGWIHQQDRYHVIERFLDFLKPYDACIVCAQFDTIFANFLGSRLIKAPNNFKKCALIQKDWKKGDDIPEKILRAFRNSRRVIVLLSDYLDEDNWMEEWNYSVIGSRIIFITKGDDTADQVDISKNFVINFNDVWFWEKLQHAMIHYEELKVEGNPDIEMQPLTIV